MKIRVAKHLCHPCAIWACPLHIYMKNEIILALLWIFYGVIHSVLASDAVKKVFPLKYYRLIYNLLAIVLLIPILYFQITMDSKRLMEDSIFNQLLGGIMMFAGIFVMYLSFKNYDLKEFIGTDFQNKKQPELTTEGLSEFVRHPLYVGILLFIWGSFGFFATEMYLVTALFLSIYIRIGIYFEENKLVRIFGKKYEEYQKNVPMLIPRL
jgi:methanethiol S-methyltransferase